SQAMTALEHQIGISLFQRKGRRLFPTKEASELSREFENYQNSLQAVLSNISSKNKDIEGLVRVGSYYEFGKKELLPKVKSFSEKFPKVKFKFVFNSPSKLQTQLEKGLLDLNFSIFSHKGRKEIESVKIFKQELVLVAHKSMAVEAKTLEGVLALPSVEYYPSHQLLPRWIRWHFGKSIRKISPKVYASSAEMLLETVNLGLGIGVVPSYIIDFEKYPDVKVLRPTNKTLEDYIWLNQFKQQFDNPAHRAFYNFMISQRLEV
ncbi:MAG: LysR family transcriptional regulator, partial [Pseudomonadota bacterium]